MPQNAIIRADGTGDYTSPQAWEAAEQSSNYGSITVGRVDGFFDSGSSQLDINGSWPNGARLEAFSSAGAFDGTERQLCGITSTGITVRGRGNKTELFGLEIYSTTTQGAYIATTSGGDTNISSCLLRTNSGTSRLNSLVGNGYVNCVLASDSDTVFNRDTVGTGNSIFANEASSVGSTDTITLSDTVVYNDDVGACFRDTVTQSNNASTDATADTLTNIVVADNFVSTTPLTSGDYRIKSGSPLDTNGIGSFVQASGSTYSITLSAGSYTYSGSDLNTKADRKLLFQAGAYAYAGQPLTLVYTPAGGPTYTIALDAGSYSYSGDEITLVANRIILLESGNYNYTGQAAILAASRKLSFDTGSYALTGNDVSLLAARKISFDTGVYNYVGNPMSLIFSGQTVTLIDDYSVSYADDDIRASYADDVITAVYLN